MDPREQERAINDLDVQIDRLRALYEQYFMGIEKLEPHVPRKQVERLIQLLRREGLRNTALRFRFQQLVNRYNTMQTYWRRVSRQIEEGTYRRDVMRARARADQRRAEVRQRIRGEEEEEEPPPTHEVDLDQEDTNPGMEIPAEATESSTADLLNDPRLSQAKGPPPPPARSNRPPPPPPGALKRPPPSPSAAASSTDLSGDRVQALYRDYISARQRCNQTTHGLTLERVSQQIRQQESTLRAKHGKSVDFQVSIRDGKAILRAVRKR